MMSLISRVLRIGMLDSHSMINMCELKKQDS